MDPPSDAPSRAEDEEPSHSQVEDEHDDEPSYSQDEDDEHADDDVDTGTPQERSFKKSMADLEDYLVNFKIEVRPYPHTQFIFSFYLRSCTLTELGMQNLCLS